METDFLRIKESFTLGDIVHIIATAHRNIFPVIDNFGVLLGVVQLDDLRRDMFNREKYGNPISHYMIQPPDRILDHESIQSVMAKFDDKRTWMLPVVDKQGHYLGFEVADSQRLPATVGKNPTVNSAKGRSPHVPHGRKNQMQVLIGAGVKPDSETRKHSAAQDTRKPFTEPANHQSMGATYS